MNALLPADLRIEDVIVVMTAISTFLVVLAVWRTFLVRNPMGSRLKTLARRRQGLREEMLSTRRRSAGELNAEHVNFMRSVVDRFSLMRSSVTDAATLKLENAGWRSRDALIAYLFLKFVLPMATGVGALVFFHGLNVYNMEPMTRTLCSLVVVVLFAYAPDIYIRNAIDKRRTAMQKGLPDGLDLMVICAEAGLSLDASLARVAREIGPAHPELADELGLTSVELGFLPERAKALENLARRSGLASIRGLVNTLTQTEKYGTPLSNSLRVLSTEFRNERMLKAEAKAARLPAILTVPMIVFIMPALFVVLLGTAIIRTIDGLGGLR
ncbi:MAG: type II secretion system F family protein [Alphaproteobacteria bacterium]|nr:type II secretion system F family protein [Alphaproteobacteria bacterium]